MTEHKLQRTRMPEYLGLLFLCLCFLLLCMVLSDASKHILDGDTSGELALAKLLTRENAIISSNWYYSTELRVLNTQLVYAPLFRVFENWRTVRTVGAILLNILLVASYLFMMRQTTVNKASRLFSAGLLMTPLSVAQARIINVHTYYIPHIAIGFLLIGLVLKYARKPAENGLVTILLFLILSFLSGLGGIRQLMVTLAPLTLTLIIRSLFCKNENTSTLMLGTLSLLRNKTLLLSMYGVAANMVGVIVNLAILKRLYSFGDQITTSFAEFSLQRGVDVFNSLLRLFGFRQGSRLFSQMGILSLVAVTLLILFSFFCIRSMLLCQREREILVQHASANFLWLFFASSFLVNTFIFTLTDAFFFELYYLPVIIFVVPLTATLLDIETTPAKGYQRLIGWFVAASILVGGLYNIHFLTQRPRAGSITKYGGLTYDNINLADDLRPALEFIEMNGYCYGYATFWHANVIRELSNGNIVCTGIHFPEVTIYPWLLEKKEAEPMLDRGPSFLLLSTEEYRRNPNHALYQRTIAPVMSSTNPNDTNHNGQGGMVSYSDRSFVVIVFEDDNEVQQMLHNR